MIIEPTVGRQVWFFCHKNQREPWAATICAVNADSTVNLGVVTNLGIQRPQVECALLQPGDDLPDEGCYATWTPYQQAMNHAEKAEPKTDGSESKVDHRQGIPTEIPESIVKAITDMDLLDSQIADIAIACHEANRAYCASIGDDSQVPWNEAPNWQKHSGIAGVKAWLADPQGMTAGAMHDAWYQHKADDGWRYGTEKDAVLKTHPQMMPFSELPEEQQHKDYLFIQMCFKAVMEIDSRADPA